MEPLEAVQLAIAALQGSGAATKDRRGDCVQDLVQRLRRRDSHRTEAEVQADVRQLILSAPFELEEGDVAIVLLESPVGDRRRIDVEVGSTVIEVKRDLRRGRVKEEAVEQLCGYVAHRAEQTGRRYVGVLTDGAEWLAYDLIDGELQQVSSLIIQDGPEPVSKLVYWLEGVLATASGVTPNAVEISARLGAGSSAHALDRATISALYQSNKNAPTIQVKRALWARLLTSALGTQFTDSDDLFIEHTLLVNTAEIIAHTVLGLRTSDINPASLLSGVKFAEAGINGVVEADFFDWVIEVPGGPEFIRTLARRLERFDWGNVQEDVMKVLYESVIGTETRKRLGEYYTPDWLAQAMVEESITDPLNTRALDPSCGSGTFLFHCARHYLAAAEQLDPLPSLGERLDGLTQSVVGMDLHPVAVTFARVTYLLAIGRDRLTAPDRGTVHIPVFLGDSLQWREQQGDLWNAGNLVIRADDERELFASQLRFPDALLADAQRFDRLVNELATRAADTRQRGPQALASMFTRLNVAHEHREVVEETFRTMCRLHDEGRNHIWGYYVRNLARPMWLSREANRVDLLIGNPPWLAYRHMPDDMQEVFRTMSQRRNLWAGNENATHQDLSALFVVRAAELYLRQGGRIAMVLPNAAVDREQYAGFRTGSYSDPIGAVAIAFDGSWDLRRIRPHFFPRGASVVFGRRSREPGALPNLTNVWTGRLPQPNIDWRSAAGVLERANGEVRTIGIAASAFGERFTQGAIFSPRLVFIVSERPSGPLGLPGGTIAIESCRSANEQKPYKQLPSVQGIVESEFVRPVFSGESLLPFRLRDPLSGVVPCTGTRLLTRAEIDNYDALSQWWRQAEDLWEANRVSERLTLLEQLDYHNKLSKQLPIAPFRVVYNKSGMHLVAAKLRDNRALIASGLYWAAFYDEAEADFLCTIMNCPITTDFVRPFMSYGKDERDIHKHVWQLPIPTYNADDPVHQELLRLGRRLALAVDAAEVDPTLHFPIARQRLRQIIEGQPEAERVSEIVFEMLS